MFFHCRRPAAHRFTKTGTHMSQILNSPCGSIYYEQQVVLYFRYVVAPVVYLSYCCALCTMHDSYIAALRTGFNPVANIG